VVSFTPQLLYSGEITHHTYWIESWADPIAGLDNMERRKLLLLPGLKF
jgi:hypothetical protein